MYFIVLALVSAVNAGFAMVKNNPFAPLNLAVAVFTGLITISIVIMQTKVNK